METKADVSIQGNTFINEGMKWDSASLEVMSTVAKGLLNMTELFKKAGATIDTLSFINVNTQRREGADVSGIVINTENDKDKRPS